VFHASTSFECPQGPLREYPPSLDPRVAVELIVPAIAEIRAVVGLVEGSSDLVGLRGATEAAAVVWRVIFGNCVDEALNECGVCLSAQKGTFATAGVGGDGELQLENERQLEEGPFFGGEAEVPLDANATRFA